jgi:spore coat polysaccharide biosynthesis predicted glycosyltransferase SpsG
MSALTVDRWLFIAAESSKIGAGHASRLRLLADSARQAGIAAEVVVLPFPGPPSGAERDPGVTRGPGRDLGSEAVVVLDGPDEFLDTMANGLHSRALKVAFRMYGVPRGALPWEDVTITPSFEPTFAREVRCPRAHLMLGGSAAVLVRSTCFQREGERKDDPPRIVVTMGGADPAGLTSIACRALLDGHVPERTTVVVGALNRSRERLHAEFGERLDVVDQRGIDFDRTLRTASVAIINGGLTRYECVAAGTPFIAISLNAHQARFTEQVVARGFGRHVGQVDSGVGARLRAEMGWLLENPRRRSAMAERAAALLNPRNAVQLVEFLIRRAHAHQGATR